MKNSKIFHKYDSQSYGRHGRARCGLESSPPPFYIRHCTVTVSRLLPGSFCACKARHISKSKWKTTQENSSTFTAPGNGESTILFRIYLTTRSPRGRVTYTSIFPISSSIAFFILRFSRECVNFSIFYQTKVTDNKRMQLSLFVF